MSHEPDSSTTAVAHGDSSSNGYETYYDGEGTLVETVLDALERASGRPTDETTHRLYDSVDPDALEALFEPTRRGPDRDAGYVSFTVGEFAVTVEAGGRVSVRPAN